MIRHMKETLQDNKEDLLYLLFVGVPTGVVMVLLSPCMDYSHLY